MRDCEEQSLNGILENVAHAPGGARTTMSSGAIAFVQDKKNQQRFLNELKELLRIPSVSTLPQHKKDVLQAAQFLADELKRIGMENVQIIPTAGHPLVYCDWLKASGKPTMLMYAHYDVQPPDPLDEWKTPPFEPTERNGNIYARGAVDDKGQMYMHVKALEALLQAHEGQVAHQREGAAGGRRRDRRRIHREIRERESGQVEGGFRAGE
jgi:hypothetical protein